MPSSGRLNFMSQLTTKLSDRKPDMIRLETQRPNPEAEPGSLQRMVRSWYAFSWAIAACQLADMAT